MIYNELFEWQKELVDKIKTRNSYGLFLDCGLGKTPISLALAEANLCDKILIITLASKVIESDKNSFEGWLKKLNYPINIVKLSGESKPKDLSFDTETDTALIVNYEYLHDRKTDKKKGVTLRKEITDFLKSCDEKRVALILDESHEIKNQSTTRSKALSKIQSLLKVYASKTYTYLLTGTPFTVGYIDLYNQLKMLGLDQTKEWFKDRFCVRGSIRGLLEWQQPIIGYKNIDRLFELVHRYAFTIESQDVIKLPEQIWDNRPIESNPSFDLLTREKIKGMPNMFYRNLAYPEMKYLAGTAGALWLRARQINIGFQGNEEDSTWYDRTRLDELKKFLTENPDNYVLFYNYVPELLELYDICEELGYKVDVFSGEVKSLVYYDQYANLTPSQKLVDKKRIILANFASGSTGKNWQEYNRCIIFSLPVYIHWAQGIKRIHRIGQDKPVIYHVFYSNNWLDKRMYESLMQKKEYNEDLFMADLNNYGAS